MSKNKKTQVIHDRNLVMLGKHLHESWDGPVKKGVCKLEEHPLTEINSFAFLLSGNHQGNHNTKSFSFLSIHKESNTITKYPPQGLCDYQQVFYPSPELWLDSVGNYFHMKSSKMTKTKFPSLESRFLH